MSRAGRPSRRLRKRYQTAHRISAELPEQRDRLKQLRQRWRQADTVERRARIHQLIRGGGSIRGIAAAIHRPESTVRYYSHPAAPPPAGVLKPPPAEPAGDQQAEQPESLESLRRRLPELLRELVGAQLGSAGTPRWNLCAPDLRETLRYYGKVPPFRLIRHLPNPLTRTELYRLTRPVQFRHKEHLDGVELATWVAALGLSLLNGAREQDSVPSREQAFRDLDRELFPPPPPTSDPPPPYPHRILYAPNPLHTHRPNRTKRL